MNKYLKLILLLVIGVVFATLITYMVILKLDNMDMTDMRFFVTYWKQSLTTLVLVLIWAIIYTTEIKK